VDVGRKELTPAKVPGLLGGESNLPAKLTAPSSGLFLERVFYEAPPVESPLEPVLILLP
jgi:hypothetical protein